MTLAASLDGMAHGFLRLATPLVLERPVGPTRQPLGARLHVRAQLQSSAQQLEGARGRCMELLDAAWNQVERDGCSVLIAFRAWEFSRFTQWRRDGGAAPVQGGPAGRARRGR